MRWDGEGSRASLGENTCGAWQFRMPGEAGGRRACCHALRLRPWVPPHCPLSPQTDIVKAIARLIEFYKHESCGQCTPCREGKRAVRAGPSLRPAPGPGWVQDKHGLGLDPEKRRCFPACSGFS